MSARLPLEIRPLTEADRNAWEPLFEAYIRFYDSELPNEQYEITWSRFHDATEPLHALGAFDDGKLVGIVHVVFHRSTWLPDTTCYLQDLYVDPSQRGRGVGEALIEKAALLARDRNAGRLYWLTQEKNDAARRLYDRVAVAPGFIQYRKPL